MPFTDPIADGPTIQTANTVALAHHVTARDCLSFVRTARSRGLTVPVLLMGYYNPVRAYGEDALLADAAAAGVNGFILVDLPPEEAVTFRAACARHRLSYVPLIAPATSEARMAVLCRLADSFIYVVSRQGVTGAAGGVDTTLLANLLARVKKYSGDVPAAVGFGVSRREQVEAVAKLADGVVVGSQMVTTLQSVTDEKAGRSGEWERKIREYCNYLCGRTEQGSGTTPQEEKAEVEVDVNVDAGAATGGEGTKDASGPGETDEALVARLAALHGVIPERFGEFGGQYVPESLMDCLSQLEEGFNKIKDDPAFWDEYRSYYPYMGRPSHLHLAERLTKHAGGARIWLKREDLNHTGSHKINNALGQLLLARRLGKTKIIAETGAGQHGVATATVCAKFGMECTVYMGAVSSSLMATVAYLRPMLC